MKPNLLFAVLMMTGFAASSQTLIGSSHSPENIAGHNQRKIVRDWYGNINVIYTDIQDNVSVIMGVRYSSNDDEWSLPFNIATGQSPTLAISYEDQIHLIFVSNSSNKQIMYMSGTDFADLSQPVALSNPDHDCCMPVADIDSSNIVNIFWNDGTESSGDHLIYCALESDTVFSVQEITVKTEIQDIAIANHLQYYTDDLFFAIGYNNDSIQFYRSTDHLASIDTLYSCIGTMPCITYNSSYNGWYIEECNLRFLYLNQDNELQEAEATSWDYSYFLSYPYPFGASQFVCIDDMAPPIGFSFLYIQNGILKHGFSYGAMWYWVTTMNTFQYSVPINYASIAYKHFDPLYADYIWTAQSGDIYNLYYIKDDKHEWIPGIDEDDEGKGFYVSGRPNPFDDNINIYITAANPKIVPEVQIYNIQSQKVRTLFSAENSDGERIFNWDGKNDSHIRVEEGIYLVLCTIGDRRIARKILFEP